MNSDRISQFSIKLIKLTTTGEIEWSAFTTQTNEEVDMEVIIDKIYKTTLNHRSLQLFKYKTKHAIDEYKFEWVTGIKLELLDNFGNTDYVFEYDNSLNDLYDVVREKTSKVSDFIDDILGYTLEILHAVYYTAKNSMDVTEILRRKIVENKLIIEASNDINGDPEYGTKKKLKVKYRYAGQEKEKEVVEGKVLIIP